MPRMSAGALIYWLVTPLRGGYVSQRLAAAATVILLRVLARRHKLCAPLPSAIPGKKQ